MGDAAALVGGGVVATALRAGRPFAATFDRRNLEDLALADWDEVVCVAPRGDAGAADDAAALERLWDALRRTAARRMVLVSTVDVYAEPRGRDERDAADASAPYGRRRAQLEARVAGGFSRAAVVRLPEVYGPGLDDGPLYDLLHDRSPRLPGTAQLQWYDLDRLPGDLDAIDSEGLALVNLVSEPVTLGAVIDRCFPGAAAAPAGGAAPQYDLRTRHARAFGGRDGYLEDRATSLEGIARFVGRVRDGEVACASPAR